MEPTGMHQAMGSCRTLIWVWRREACIFTWGCWEDRVHRSQASQRPRKAFQRPGMTSSQSWTLQTRLNVSSEMETEWGPTGLGLALNLREKRERSSSRFFLQGRMALTSLGRQLGLVMTLARSQIVFTAGG